MAGTLDARGFSCPQPVMMTLLGIKSTDEKELQILVDTDTSRENVSRAAASQGWRVTRVEEEDIGYRIIITKG
jgi:TusA-related sulfurtransferase